MRRFLTCDPSRDRDAFAGCQTGLRMHRERVVQPGQTITVYIPALAPGTYSFVDDFSHGAVKGEIVSR